ncbi:MAG: hypothetical protein Q9198_008741, partial [Flavoplaca austrocitrina]
MRTNLQNYVTFSILLVHVFASPLHLRRRQYLNGAWEYYGVGNMSAIGSDAISHFHPNGSYVDTLELPDIDGKNFTGCRHWPHIGQRIHVRKLKWFTSTTSTSELSFWVHDIAHGFYDHCINVVPPGWDLLQTYVMTPCLNKNITFELQGSDASTLVIREYIECRGFWALAEAKGHLDGICAPVLDGSQ